MMTEGEDTRKRRVPVWFYRVLDEMNDILESLVKTLR